jgi:hypothetical protein
LIEHVATHVLTPFMGSGLGELLAAMAIDAAASDGVGWAMPHLTGGESQSPRRVVSNFA